jgi:hypothetical protein
MNYTEAIKESLKVKWVSAPCPTGEECWCRVIKCDPPLMFKENENSDEEEYRPVRAGELGKDTVEHFVELHNKHIEENDNRRI